MIKIYNKNIYLFDCHGGGGAEKFYNNIKKEIPDNNFVSEIDFNEPLNNDKSQALKSIDIWIDNLNISQQVKLLTMTLGKAVVDGLCKAHFHNNPFDFDEDLGVKMFARVTQSILGG